MIIPAPSQLERAQEQAHGIVSFWGVQGHKVRAWIEEIQTKLGSSYSVKTDMINGLPRSFTPSAARQDVFPSMTVRKKRLLSRPRGEDSPTSKLNEDIVRKIRQQKKAGATCVEISREYGVTRQTIRCVVSRKYWAHVA